MIVIIYSSILCIIFIILFLLISILYKIHYSYQLENGCIVNKKNSIVNKYNLEYKAPDEVNNPATIIPPTPSPITDEVNNPATIIPPTPSPITDAIKSSLLIKDNIEKINNSSINKYVDFYKISKKDYIKQSEYRNKLQDLQNTLKNLLTYSKNSSTEYEKFNNIDVTLSSTIKNNKDEAYNINKLINDRYNYANTFNECYNSPSYDLGCSLPENV